MSAERCPTCGCPLDDGTGTEHECPPGFLSTVADKPTLEGDYALVKQSLLEYEAETDWDTTDERHALARIGHAMHKAGLLGERAAPTPRYDGPLS